jgi:hypothetical protein
MIALNINDLFHFQSGLIQQTCIIWEFYHRVGYRGIQNKVACFGGNLSMYSFSLSANTTSLLSSFSMCYIINADKAILGGMEGLPICLDMLRD